MCKVLQVSKSGYYKWVKSSPSKRFLENQQLTEQIREIHSLSKQTYGSPRITKALRDRSYNVSRQRVARLMRKAGIRSKIRKKYIATTDSKHTYHVAANLLDRNFKVGSIGQVWVSDITYISTKQGWLYLTTVIDLGDRKVIGWSLGSTLKAADTSVAAFNMAIKNRPITQQLIFHSDRGVQYACNEFTDILKKYKTVKQSMSRKGNCWDNAVAESFFKTLKSEWTNWHKYQSVKQAALSVFEYIEGWYNLKRKHSALGYLSPAEYEKYLLTKKSAA
jgi:transposase InsO family protein